MKTNLVNSLCFSTTRNEVWLFFAEIGTAKRFWKTYHPQRHD